MLVVLGDWRQGGERVQEVVRKVQHVSAGWEGGEGGQALRAAVDQHSEGGRGVWGGGKVMEMAGAHLRTEGINLGSVILHHLQKGRHLM